MYTQKEGVKTTPKLKDLAREMRQLKSLLISMVGKDKEGDYRPEFVTDILQATNEKPTNRFSNPNSFLRQLRTV